jgi:heat-inducible transcriptional repressor
MLLNTNLNGLTVSDINLELIERMRRSAGEHDEIVEQVLKTVADTITDDEEFEIYTSGATNIFKYPELSDNKESDSEIIETLSDREELKEFIRETQNDEELKKNGIRVMIGAETPLETMKDCSVVTTTYELSDGVKGSIAIIGPKRMDYRKVVETMARIKTGLDRALKKGSSSDE